jgi:hypothetical protein
MDNDTTQTTFPFLELPPEIRARVYDLFFAVNVDASLLGWPRRSTDLVSLMQTCKLVRNEAINQFYMFKAVTMEIDRNQNVRYCRRSIPFKSFNSTEFFDVSSVRKVLIYIEATREWLCEMQDVLFTFFNLFPRDNQLRSISIHIRTEERNSTGPGKNRGFDPIEQSGCTQDHAIAFLTDPVRTLRGFKGGLLNIVIIDSGTFSRAWKDLRRDTRLIIKGDSHVPDYQIFVKYFEILRKVIDFVTWVEERRPFEDRPSNRRRHLAQFDKARIVGDVASVRELHTKLMETLETLFKTMPDPNDWQEFKEKRQQTSGLLPQLRERLPHGDTSDFGYAVVERALEQSPGRTRSRNA